MDEPAALVTESDVRLLVDEVLEDPVIFHDRREAPILSDPILDENDEIVDENDNPQSEFEEALLFNHAYVDLFISFKIK